MTDDQQVIQVDWFEEGCQANAFLADYNPHDIIKIDFVPVPIVGGVQIYTCVMYYTARKE